MKIPRQKLQFLIILLLTIIFTISCKKDRLNPLDPKNPNSNVGILPPPDVTVSLDFRTVILSWDLIPNAVSYRVFRDDENIVTVDTNCFENKTVEVNKQYKYQVNSVHESGLGGHLSTPVYAVPKDLIWEFNDAGNSYSSPAIGDNDDVYVCGNGYLYALSQNGKEQWNYYIDDYIGVTPVISDDNTTIYILNKDYLYALSAGGSLKWKQELSCSYRRYLSIANDGMIYIPLYDTLVALNTDGTLMWKCTLPGIYSKSTSIGAEGTIFVNPRSYSRIYALNPDGTIKWLSNPAELSGIISNAFAIDDEEILYFISWLDYTSPALISVDGNTGNIRWTFNLGSGSYINEEPNIVIGANGTIYTTSSYGLCSITKSGTLRWKVRYGGYVYGTPVVGQNGTIYVTGGGYLYAINPDSTLNWSYHGLKGEDRNQPPVIANGKIYIQTNIGLYAIRAYGELENASWPCFQHDAKHSGRK